MAKAKEKISKQKAKKLYDSGKMNKIEVGTFNSDYFVIDYSNDPIFASKRKTAGVLRIRKAIFGGDRLRIKNKNMKFTKNG